MLVKICGIQTKEAAESAVTHGADLIGFVFAESKRKITPQKAAEITSTIPKDVKKVGVFVNESVENMIKIAEKVDLDYIQLHGDETPKIAEMLPYRVIKAFSVDPERLSEIKSYPCDYYLLDSPKGKYRGGNGTTFDWNLIDQLFLDTKKVILAGGLSSENVDQAIKQVLPAGVDVSSGVETNGIKDHVKIKQFIQQAKKTRKDEKFDNVYDAQ